MVGGGGDGGCFAYPASFSSGIFFLSKVRGGWARQEPPLDLPLKCTITFLKRFLLLQENVSIFLPPTFIPHYPLKNWNYYKLLYFVISVTFETCPQWFFSFGHGYFQEPHLSNLCFYSILYMRWHWFKITMSLKQEGQESFDNAHFLPLSCRLIDYGGRGRGS